MTKPENANFLSSPSRLPTASTWMYVPVMQTKCWRTLSRKPWFRRNSIFGFPESCFLLPGYPIALGAKGQLCPKCSESDRYALFWSPIGRGAIHDRWNEGIETGKALRPSVTRDCWLYGKRGQLRAPALYQWRRSSTKACRSEIEPPTRNHSTGGRTGGACGQRPADECSTRCSPTCRDTERQAASRSQGPWLVRCCDRRQPESFRCALQIGPYLRWLHIRSIRQGKPIHSARSELR